MSTDITIKVKQTATNTVVEVQTSLESSVLEFKLKIQELTEIEPELQNLIYKGKILVDEKTLNDYSIQDNFTVILVKKVKAGDKSIDLKRTYRNGKHHN